MIAKRTLGRTGLQVCPIGFGGAEIGLQAHDGPAAITQLLNEALDAGLNVIDTASAYLESEKLIGNAVGHRRADFYLFTKCGATDGFQRSDWSAKGITAQLDASLRALRTDYVDILQLHSCDIATLDRGDAILALKDLQASGKVRYLGYSGDGLAALHALKTNQFDTLQTSLSIADQEAITLTLPLALTQDVGVIAKRPIANAAWRTGKLPEESYHHTYFHRLAELAYPELSLPIEQAVIQALLFTLAQKPVATAIVGTNKPGRFQQNLKALAATEFSAAKIAQIRKPWLTVATKDWTGQV